MAVSILYPQPKNKKNGTKNESFKNNAKIASGEKTVMTEKSHIFVYADW